MALNLIRKKDSSPQTHESSHEILPGGTTRGVCRTMARRLSHKLIVDSTPTFYALLATPFVPFDCRASVPSHPSVIGRFTRYLALTKHPPLALLDCQVLQDLATLCAISGSLAGDQFNQLTNRPVHKYSFVPCNAL